MSVAHRLVLGTACFNQNYAGRPAIGRDEAAALVRAAHAAGIRWVDTSPSYGCERWLGALMPRDMKLSTRVLTGSRLAVETSVLRSRDNIGRPIDLAFIQPASPARQEATDAAMDSLRRQGAVLTVGTSCYEIDEAMASFDGVFGLSRVLQVPFSLIDQRMRPVLREVGRLGYPPAVWVRSVWLRGLLTGPGLFPNAQTTLAVVRCCRWLGVDLDGLPECALRFALYYPHVDKVVIGPRCVAELSDILRWAEHGPLPWRQRMLARFCASHDRSVYDPRVWDKDAACA